MWYNCICLHIIVVRWLAPHAFDCRERWAWARFTPFALDRGDQRRFLTADERPGALAYFQIEREIRAEDVRTQEAELTRLGDGNIQVLYRDRVFGPAVDIAQAGARGVGCDDHAFQHRVRVAFQHAPVHERTRVALVGIARQIFGAVGHIPA